MRARQQTELHNKNREARALRVFLCGCKEDGQTFGPYTYRAEDAVFVFLRYLQNHEREMRKDMENKRPLVMTYWDWQKYKKARECHICNKSLYKDLYLDSRAVYDPDSGKYSGQSHRSCCFTAMKYLFGPERKKKKNRRRNQSMDRKNSGSMSVLCRTPQSRFDGGV